MGLRVKTNVDALVAQRRLGETRKQLGESIEKLSSGLRINKSADDAAGLAVSESIRSRVASLNVAKRNASDGISYIQVAEGGLNEVTNAMIRMRELAMQAASDTLGPRERSFLDKEFMQLRDEVGRMIDSTEFNGSKVLKAGDGDKPIQIFVGASNRAADAAGNLPNIDLEKDPDVLTIKLDDLSNLQTAIEAVTAGDMSILGGGELERAAQELGPTGDTNELFSTLDTALNAVAAYRATLGSVQSRINSTIANIDISNENLQAAQSRIRDVDYATETAKFTQANILSSAGVSVLTHASAAPEAVLQLLRG
jgi:flagellin